MHKPKKDILMQHQNINRSEDFCNCLFSHLKKKRLVNNNAECFIGQLKEKIIEKKKKCDYERNLSSDS